MFLPISLSLISVTAFAAGNLNIDRESYIMTPKSGYIFLVFSQVRHSTARIEWCKTLKHFDRFESNFFFLLAFSKRQKVQI